MEHVTPAAAARYDDCVRRLIEAQMRFGERQLFAAQLAEDQKRFSDSGWYRATISVPTWEGGSGPYRILFSWSEDRDALTVFRRIAGRCWHWLPPALAQHVLQAVRDTQLVHFSRSDCWIWLLWYAASKQVAPRSTTYEIQLPLFSASISLIHDLRLNTPTPIRPTWLSDWEARKDNEAKLKTIAEELDEARTVGDQVHIDYLQREQRRIADPLTVKSPDEQQRRIKKLKAAPNRPGDAEKKITGFLLAHHGYDDGKCRNYTAATTQQIKEGADVSQGSTTNFFNKYFAGSATERCGRKRYEAACDDRTKLDNALRMLAGDVIPAILWQSLPADLADNTEQDYGEDG